MLRDELCNQLSFVKAMSMSRESNKVHANVESATAKMSWILCVKSES